MPRLLTDQDVAERWGVSPFTVARLRREGGIPFVHITPRLVRMRVEDIEAYERSQLIPSNEDTGIAR